MGMFRVHVEATGNHGCQRYVKDGEIVEGCGQPNCADCITREYIKTLKGTGNGYEIKATLEHWPTSEPPGPVDDLVSGIRKGSF